jgi:N-acetylmuramoyl-L-alanine amidase
MKIQRHRLQADPGAAFDFQASPNVGDRFEPRYLVMHYTAGRSTAESVRWLCARAAGASAHLVIGRDGSVTQLVPFDRVAWHAGPSRWQGLTGLNQHAIGIELDNAGRLTRQGGAWRAWFGATYTDDEVMEATHKHETVSSGWHVYTPEQIDRSLEVAAALIRAYDLEDVLGHEDISPGRKSDPGPAFPMASFRSRLLGRRDDAPPRFAASAALNIREGPGTMHAKLAMSPLPPGTEVEVLRESGVWRFVDVVGEVGGDHDVQGWVHGDYLRPIE